MSRNSLQTRPQRSSLEVKPEPICPSPNRNRYIRPSFRRRIQYYYWRLIRLSGPPEVIARGLACGVFAGLFPLFGLQTILGICLALIFRGNKIIAAAGTWVSNPLTYVPIYAFNFHVGQWLLQENGLTDISLGSWQEFKELGSEIIGTLFVGCFTVGMVGAISSYFLGLIMVRRVRASYRSRRQSHR
ncbi:DUF2062 domain-containing protein [Coleofasciculus sp. G2-EDA-02]|uniref:DUF2062 domain-containing protein n=1 Tax=Coleofasciculus sp. G2-EDA-02 TaxID=3069529 RepID=UPI0033007448